jgi:hypothetical protein
MGCSQGSTVVAAGRERASEQRSSSPGGFFCHCPQIAGTQPPACAVATGSRETGLRRPACHAACPPPKPGVEVQNVRAEHPLQAAADWGDAAPLHAICPGCEHGAPAVVEAVGVGCGGLEPAFGIAGVDTAQSQRAVQARRLPVWATASPIISVGAFLERKSYKQQSHSPSYANAHFLARRCCSWGHDDASVPECGVIMGS